MTSLSPVLPCDPASLERCIELQVASGALRARSRHGVPPLVLDPRLSAIARAHSADMLARVYFSHTSPDGSGAGERVRRARPDVWAEIAELGENLYRIDLGRLVDRRDSDEIAALGIEGWLASPGHRRNLLDVKFSSTGVGVSVRGGAVTVTQLLAAAGISR